MFVGNENFNRVQWGGVYEGGFGEEDGPNGKGIFLLIISKINITSDAASDALKFLHKTTSSLLIPPSSFLLARKLIWVPIT